MSDSRSSDVEPVQAVDPVGDFINFLADVIVEHRPNGRRRLTMDWGVARGLAEEIVEAMDEWAEEQTEAPIRPTLAELYDADRKRLAEFIEDEVPGAAVMRHDNDGEWFVVT